MRRVVTGHDANGRSIIVSDGEPPFIADTGDGEPKVGMMWATDTIPVVPHDGTDPTTALTMTTVFPGPGGTRVMMVRHPPGAGTRHGASQDSGTDVDFDETGMHATDTVDYAIVVSGTICMELDDGAEVTLSAGDVLVQNGTRHGWRNRSEAEAIVAVVIVGADIVGGERTPAR